jgi:hypothetical protein
LVASCTSLTTWHSTSVGAYRESGCGCVCGCGFGKYDVKIWFRDLGSPVSLALPPPLLATPPSSFSATKQTARLKGRLNQLMCTYS